MNERGSSNNTLFSETSLFDFGLNASRSTVDYDEEAERTLLAIKEFARYLSNVEKDLSSMSKKWRNKEIAQGVGFVGTGIHEALQYLGIVKKVITKTRRFLDKKALASSLETAGPSRKIHE
ncbi:MAG TPA: hypothetical protein VFE96_01740 [Candidatus Bathyarchaeia archaeon]|jgi:hypothetical protein|nr:hypothetical protein [Candidatus Bathyarchaeia archaeon]